MRAAHIQENIQTLAHLGPEVAQRIKARMNPETLRRIEQATRLDWLPLQCDVELSTAVEQETGLQGVFEWSRKALLASAQTPLLSPLFAGARALFGLTPMAFLRWSDRLWGSIYRGCGTLQVEAPGPHEALVTNEEAPLEMCEREDYCQGIAGAAAALFDLCKVRGTVEVQRDPRARRVRYHLRWSAK